MFFRGSRYEAVPDAEIDLPDGRRVAYKRRRAIPDTPAPLAAVVRAGERVDLLAWRTLGDPELYWMLCDANGERRPADLAAEAGRTVKVPGPPAGGL